MKKRLLFLGAACALAIGVFAFGGCKKKPENGNESVKITEEVENQLTKLLNLRVEEENLCWNNVVNATGYTLYINGEQAQEYAAGDTLSYEYDKSENDYTAKLTVRGEKLTNFSVSVQYSVKRAEIEAPEVFANSVRFAPQPGKIYFRIAPATEWKEINESNYINFGGMEKGSVVEYEYYVQGTGYDKATRTYYTDGAVRKNSLKIKRQLPDLTLSAKENRIEWEKIDGAASYTVIADGESTITQLNYVSFNEAEGSHAVCVYANPQDEENFAPSDRARFDYRTKKQSVETFTVGENAVIFDEKMLGVLQYKNGGEWQKAVSATLNKENLSVKYAGYYDEKSGVYHLESKPLAFKKGGKLQVSFDREGYLNIENGGKSVEFKLYGTDEDEPGGYRVTAESQYYIGNCEAGRTYVFESKFLNRTARGEAEDTYSEYEADRLEFYALPAPDVKIRNGKVVWTIDERAEKYVYGTEEGQLSGETMQYFAADEAAERYYMQAIGSNENHVLNSAVSSADATKWALTFEQLEEGYLFGNARNVKGAATGSSSISAEYDEAKNAMKITPKAANKEVSIAVDGVTLNKGDKLIVSALSTINVGFRVNGKWKMTLQDKNGTDFKEYAWEVPEKITVTEMGIMPYTKFGELYVRSVRILAQTKISVSQLEQGFAFDSPAKVFGRTVCDKGVEASYDAEKNAMKITLTGTQNLTAAISVEAFTLNKGDKIVICALSNINTGLLLNGKYAMTVQEKDGTDFKEYVYTATEETAVSDISLKMYAKLGKLYVQSVKIVRAA